ncbi:MAG: transcription termination/antitermination protein NusG [Puniceicoccaceae bacterium]
MDAGPDNEPAETPEKRHERWFCLRSRTKQEHIAAALIRAQVDVEVFAPRITYSKKTRRGKVRFTEALFPGYLFSRCSIDRHLRHLLSIQGVIGIVRYGAGIPTVPQDFIDELKQRIPGETAETPDPVIEIGASVTVVEGPFKDLQAVVTKVMGARDRVRVLLEFLGRDTEIEIPATSVFREGRRPREGF